MKVQQLTFKITGFCPFMMGAYICEEKREDETDMQFENRACLQRCTTDTDGHLAIKAAAVHRSLVFGGKKLRMNVKGEGKTEYTGLIDSGIIYKGYITDMTRVFYQRKPDKLEQKIYTTVLEANQTAIKAVKVGMKFSDLDKVPRNVIKKAGYGKFFTHSTGHGTGLEVHEAPTVSVHSKEVVKLGMVFTIEPGIYIKGKSGVRIEDNRISVCRIGIVNKSCE